MSKPTLHSDSSVDSIEELAAMDIITTADRDEDAEDIRSRPSKYRRFWRRFMRNKLGVIGLLVFLGVIFTAIFAEQIAPHDPTQLHYDSIMEPPSREFLLGTDSQGRDILSRIIFGTRISLQVGLVAVSFAASIGTVLGIISGYEGGIVDEIIMRFVDAMMSIPVLALAMALMAILGFGITNLMIAVGIVYIPTFARISRGSTLTIKEKEYITAIQSVGASRKRILIKHIFPNILHPLLVQGSLAVAFAILAEAGLSFLGLGVQPPTSSWGMMLSDGRNYLGSAPWIATFPGIAIMITVFGLNTLGDALRDILDPHESTEERF